MSSIQSNMNEWSEPIAGANSAMSSAKPFKLLRRFLKDFGGKFPSAVLSLFALCAAFVAGVQPLDAQALNPIAPLYFTMLQGNNPPPAQVFELTSTGNPIPIVISVNPGTGGNWLSTGTGGTTTQYTAVAAINGNVASNLPAGIYSSEISIRPSNGTATVNIPVTLVIAASGTNSLVGLAGALNFQMPENGQPSAAKSHYCQYSNWLFGLE